MRSAEEILRLAGCMNCEKCRGSIVSDCDDHHAAMYEVCLGCFETMLRMDRHEAAEEMRERAARLLQSDNHLIARAIRALPVEAWREEPSS